MLHNWRNLFLDGTILPLALTIAAGTIYLMQIQHQFPQHSTRRSDEIKTIIPQTVFTAEWTSADGEGQKLLNSGRFHQALSAHKRALSAAGSNADLKLLSLEKIAITQHILGDKVGEALTDRDISALNTDQQKSVPSKDDPATGTEKTCSPAHKLINHALSVWRKNQYDRADAKYDDSPIPPEVELARLELEQGLYLEELSGERNSIQEDIPEAVIALADMTQGKRGFKQAQRLLIERAKSNINMPPLLRAEYLMAAAQYAKSGRQPYFPDVYKTKAPLTRAALTLRQQLLPPDSWSTMASLVEMNYLNGAMFYYEQTPQSTQEYLALMHQELALVERHGNKLPMVSSDVNETSINAGLSYAYFRLGDHKNAEQHLNKVIRIIDRVTLAEAGKNEHSCDWMPSGIQQLWELTTRYKGAAETKRLQKKWYPEMQFSA